METRMSFIKDGKERMVYESDGPFSIEDRWAMMRYYTRIVVRIDALDALAEEESAFDPPGVRIE